MTITTINTYLPTCFTMMEWPSTLLTPTYPLHHDGMTISTINTYLPTHFTMMEWPSTLLTPTYRPTHFTMMEWPSTLLTPTYLFYHDGMTINIVYISLPVLSWLTLFTPTWSRWLFYCSALTINTFSMMQSLPTLFQPSYLSQHDGITANTFYT